MEVVDDILNSLTLRSRRSSQSENSEMRIDAHEVSHDSDVGVISTRSMRLVHHQARYIPRIQSAFLEIILDCLRSRIDYSFRFPRDRSEGRCGVTSELDAVLLHNSGNVVACFDLLSDERSSRSEEEDFPFWIPAIEIEPISNNQLAHRNHEVVKGTYMTQAAMKVFPNPVGSETSVFSKRAE